MQKTQSDFWILPWLESADYFTMLTADYLKIMNNNDCRQMEGLKPIKMAIMEFSKTFGCFWSWRSEKKILMFTKPFTGQMSATIDNIIQWKILFIFYYPSILYNNPLLVSI